MPNPAMRRLLTAVISLALAALACARADVPFTPAVPVTVPPRLPPPTSVFTNTPESSPTTPATDSPPTETPLSGYPGPETPIAEATTGGYPGGEASPTVIVVAEVSPTPTDTPISEPAATDTAVPVVPTDTPASAPTDTPVPAATDTPAPQPTDTAVPVPPTATQPIPTPAGPPPGNFPPGTVFVQDFKVTFEGTIYPAPRWVTWLTDGKTTSWVSLDGGNGAWILDLGNARNFVGLRLYPHHTDQDPSLLGIEASTNGTDWTALYVGEGNCDGTPSCDTLASEQFLEFPLGSLSAQFIRLRGGPTRFAFAEMQVAVIP